MSMFEALSCRLCINICNGHHSLYDEDGRSTEVYKQMKRYFTPKLLNAEYTRHLKVICTECWRHIFEFHLFKQSVLLAHRILSKEPKGVVTAGKDDPLEASEVNAVPPNSEVIVNSQASTPIATDGQSHNDVRSEDLINSSNCSQGRDNVSCNDGEIKVEAEVPLEASDFNSNPSKAIATKCPNEGRSGEFATPSPGDPILKSESDSEVLTKNTASTSLRVQGNVSCDEKESEISDDLDEECEEFDDPVGVFGGGEFDKHIKEESELLSESEWNGSFRSDNKVPLAVQTRQRKLEPKIGQPKEQESRKTLLAPEHQGKATSKSKTTISNDNSNGANKRKRKNSPERNLKRHKSGAEFGVNESEGLFEQCTVTTKRTKRDKPRQVTASKDNLATEFNENFQNKPKSTPLKSNSSESKKKRHTTDQEDDVSASESESDEDFSSGDEISTAESTVQTRTAKAAAKSGRKKQYSRRKNISYKQNLKRPQTVEEFDEYIAHWKPNLECVICKEACSSFSLLHKHFEKHHPKEECHIVCCQHKFYHRYEIEKHIHFHSEPKAFKCEVCYKCFTLASSLRDHLTEKHSGRPKGDDLKCPKCSRCYSNKNSLRTHLKYACNTGKKATSKPGSLGHTCGECGREYKTLKTLQRHKRSAHLGLGKNPLHKCSICDKVYKYRTDLDDHMATHTGQPTNTCPFCPEKFVFRPDVYAHLRKKHPKEWDKKQKEKAELSKNKEKKVYKCTTCENVYSTSLGLVEHRATHAGKALYTCSLCPNSYKYSSNVAAHFKRVHFIEWQKKNKGSL